MKIETYIERYDPCSCSIPFLKQFDTFQEAWGACARGDWMLSAAKLLEVDIRTLTLAKGLCANTVGYLMTDPRSIAAVNAAISFGKGEIDEGELEKYADDAALVRAAIVAARPDGAPGVRIADSDGAIVAAVAFYAAFYAAAACAADYAAAVASAAATSNHVAALKENRKQTADICREVLTGAVMEKMAKENK